MDKKKILEILDMTSKIKRDIEILEDKLIVSVFDNEIGLEEKSYMKRNLKNDDYLKLNDD